MAEHTWIKNILVSNPFKLWYDSNWCICKILYGHIMDDGILKNVAC